MTHFAFVRPFDQPDYVPQDGDTWMEFREPKWTSKDGSVMHGKGLISRRFTDGEWREYDPIAEYPADIRKMIDEARSERGLPPLQQEQTGEPLVAMASNDLFEAVVEALESPETPEGHPDLALEIDERSQQLAYELRAFRGGLIDRGWKPA